MKAKWIFLVAIFAAAYLPSHGDFARAQAPDSVYAWEFSIAGNATGLGVIRFLGENRLAGYLMVKVTPNPKTAALLAGLKSGFVFFRGQWDVESDGDIIGFLSAETSEIPIDMSFSGRTSRNTIRLSATGNYGSWKLKGTSAAISAVPGLDRVTSWTNTMKKNSTIPFVEFFTSEPYVCLDFPENSPERCEDFVDEASPSPVLLNLYAVEGSGPGYEIDGYILVGAGNRIGIVVTEHPIDKDTLEPEEDGVVRSVTGKLKLPKASLTGGDDNNAFVRMVLFGQ